MPYVLFALICFVWGSSFILMKYALVWFPPISLAAWRVILGFVVLALLWWKKKIPWPFKRNDYLPIAIMAATGYAAPFVIQPYLIGEIDRIADNGSAFVGMMVCFVPLVTVVASVPMLGRKPNTREVIGVLGGLVCMAVILADGIQRNIPVIHIKLAFSVPVVYALSNVYVKRRFAEMPTVPLSCLFLAFTAIILLPLSLGLETIEWPLSIGPETIEIDEEFTLAASCLFGLGAVGTGLATYWFFLMVQKQGPLFAGMSAYIIPIGAVLWGAAVKEKISFAQVAALVGVLVLVAIAQYGAAGRQAAAEPEPPK